VKRLLITGGSGYLGWRLTQMATASGEWETFPTFLANRIDHPNGLRLDLRDRAATETVTASLRPEVIIHQAVSPRNSEHIAAMIPAARHIMQAAAEIGARLIHVSTDMIWDGTRPPYGDDSPPSPLTPYAEAKAAIENMIADEMPQTLIVRPSLIYGFDPIDKQTGWIVSGIRRSETVRLFTDELRCPIWVDTLATALLELADSDHSGRLNIAGRPLNRWDFGMKMLAALGIEPGPNVIRSTIAESGLARPADLTMDTSKARQWLRTPLISVDEAAVRHQRQAAR